MDKTGFFKNKDILITGGLGFIGSNLAHRLVDSRAKVTLADSLIPEYGGNIFNIVDIKDKVSVNIVDIRNKESVKRLVKNRDIIFNLAGTLSHIDSMNDPYTDLSINCLSQISILESCRRYNPEVKILFAGTRGQYGKPQYLPVDEEHPVRPQDANGVNKTSGESYHMLYNDVYGIKTTSLRLTNTYGPRHQMHHSRQGIINWFIRLIIEGKEVKLYGDGDQIRDCNYIDDVVEALLLAALTENTNGEIYNLGGTHASLKDIVQTLIKINGKGRYKLVLFPKTNKAIEIGDYIADYRKFSKVTGWKPRVSLEEGLIRTIAYYKKYRNHYW